MPLPDFHRAQILLCVFMQLGIINAKNDCDLLLSLCPTSIPCPSLTSTLKRLFFKIKQKKIEMKWWLISLPFLARGARQMMSLLSVSRQPPHSLQQPCQHRPVMPANCCKCHCAAANFLPLLLQKPLKVSGSFCTWCPGSWACIRCVVFHLLLLLSPPLTGKLG